jgi:hypothetical protein
MDKSYFVKSYSNSNDKYKRDEINQMLFLMDNIYFFMAIFDRVNGPMERTPIWEYPKIGPWFEIMTSVDADLRTGRRSESIIYMFSLED